MLQAGQAVGPADWIPSEGTPRIQLFGVCALPETQINIPHSLTAGINVEGATYRCARMVKGPPESGDEGEV
jgi:hypothetical protein